MIKHLYNFRPDNRKPFLNFTDYMMRLDVGRYLRETIKIQQLLPQICRLETINTNINCCLINNKKKFTANEDIVLQLSVRLNNVDGKVEFPRGPSIVSVTDLYSQNCSTVSSRCVTGDIVLQLSVTLISIDGKGEIPLDLLLQQRLTSIATTVTL